MISRALDTLGGLWQLARLLLLTRGRIRGPYWEWRLHTAFGRGFPPRGELVRSVLDYGRWIHRTRSQR